MKTLSAEVKSKIESKIEELERLTSAEFVCVFREASSHLSGWLRFLTPRKFLLEQVEDAAQIAFLHEEIFATQDRTGVLIFISERERAVFVLADRGVTQKVSPEEFARLGQNLALEFSKRSASDIFLYALDEISRKLGNHFPPRVENPDELSNRVR